jgi:hypothetical protein
MIIFNIILLSMLSSQECPLLFTEKIFLPAVQQVKIAETLLKVYRECE